LLVIFLLCFSQYKHRRLRRKAEEVDKELQEELKDLQDDLKSEASGSEEGRIACFEPCVTHMFIKFQDLFYLINVKEIF
jgi:hypothetical protein